MISIGQKARTKKNERKTGQTEKQNFLALGDMVRGSNKVLIESRRLVFLPIERRYDGMAER